MKGHDQDVRFIILGTNGDYKNFFLSYLNDPEKTTVPYLKVVEGIPFENFVPETAANDIGLVRYVGQLPVGFRPTSLGVQAPQMGETFLLSGYGYTKWMAGEEGTLRSVWAPVVKVATDNSFQTAVDGQTSCSGDSGGPAYRFAAGRHFQVAVISNTADYCQSTAGLIQVTNFVNWMWSKGAEPRWNPQVPTATLESVGQNKRAPVLLGLAFDPDVPAVVVDVHVYVDGPAGVGRFLGAWKSNVLRADVNAANGLTGNHGFEIALNVDLSQGAHSVFVYAIDVNDPLDNALAAGSGVATFPAVRTVVWRKVLATKTAQDRLWTLNPAEAPKYRLEGPAFQVFADAQFGGGVLMRYYAKAKGHYLSAAVNCEEGIVESILGFSAASGTAGTSVLWRCRKKLTAKTWLYFASMKQGACEGMKFEVEGPIANL